MEVKEVERAVITKPVASKPSCSRFRSFSELLAGAINASPSPGITRSNYAVAAIRPKTIRAKPTSNRVSTAMLSSQGEASGTAPIALADKVLYKPLAKVVSKATVTLLASMGSPNITHQQALAQVEACAQHVNLSYLHTTNQPIANPPPNIVSQQVEKAQQLEPPKRASKTVEEEPKLYAVAANVDRPSYDGYNWRKYGQKQVKGSEYPRSYYKCTHPNCPVKKKVERSFDGQIAEIVYKGEHNHPKPQPPKRSSSGAQGQGLANDGTGQDQDTNNPTRSNNNNSELNEALEGHVKNHGEGVGLPAQLTYPNKSQLLLPYDHGAIGAHGIGGGTPDNLCGRSADCEEASKGLGADVEEPRSKRRRSGNSNNEVGTSGEAIQEPQISVQSAPETEIVGDGFRWRKYGQKVVKRNPYPRSYYKCTSLKCNVRKYVERASDDPRAFITTYEGKHNHDMPTKITNSAASQPHSQAPTAKKL